MDPRDRYTGSSVWVTRLVERASDLLALHPVPASLLTVGALPVLLSAAFLLLLPAFPPLSFVAAQASAAVIGVAGPALVWHYDENVFPTFISEVTDVVCDHEALVDRVERWERFFASRYWLITVPWCVLIVAALLANLGFFVSLGVSGYFDPAYLTYAAFVVWMAVLTSLGLHMMLTTTLCIRDVGDLELTIDPLHHDGLGGLSTIGYFSIRTTLINSIGSFGLPLAFTVASHGQSGSLVYAAVAGYIGFILLSFVYPTLYVNRRAQEVRESVLKEKREQIHRLREQMASDDSKGELSELETQLKIRTLRDDFHEYQAVNLYPLSVSILARLASSVLLPITFTLLETYVFTG